MLFYQCNYCNNIWFDRTETIDLCSNCEEDSIYSRSCDKVIMEFKGPFSFLSNFYPSPFKVDGVKYPTVEHFFQSMKTTNLIDRRRIASIDSPKDAKRLGRSVDLVKNWDQLKDGVMYIGVYEKFRQNEHLRELLVATHPASIEEGNYWHGNYWRVCRCPKCTDEPKRNKLGQILETVRYLLS